MLDLLPMPHTVIIKRSGSLDDWGLPDTEGTSQTVRARVSDNTQRKTISVANGNQVVYAADILLSGTPTITYEDTVTWVDSLGNSIVKKPLVIQLKQDLSGNATAVKVVV